MAEAKRIELTTVGPLKKDRKPKEDSPTYRFQLTLCESNEKTCPEYSYLQLLKSVRGETENGTIVSINEPVEATDSADPFGDDANEQEKLKALAQKFEEKYAPKPGKKPWRKRGRLEDYIDLGMGYDETDPFIDNTDAYDELVPSTLTTQYGGFYINSGKLDFKEVNTESSDEEFPDSNRKRKKQRLKEYDKELRRKKRLRDGRDGELPKKRGRKPLEKTDGALLKISKKQPTVAALLQHHKAQQQLQQQKIQDQPQQSPEQPQQVSVSPSPAQQQAQQTHSTAMQLQTAAIATSEAAMGLGLGGVLPKVEGSITDAIESVVVAAREKDSNGAEFQTMSSSGDSDNGTLAMESEVSPKLPEGISNHLEDAIKNITLKAAAQKSHEGKCKFFSHEVNNLLLSIELMSRELSCSQRSTVYAHLASHFPCTKETLQKRAKKLRLDQEGGKLREPMRRLKQAINEIMPSLEETYKARCLVAAEGGMKVTEASSSEDDKDDSENCEGQSEGDDDKDRSSQDDEMTDGNVKIIRKNFEWSEKIRKLLCDVVQIKMKCYEVSKTRTTSADEYLKRFLDLEVKHLWPKGWMRLRRLLKESRHVHAYLTDPPKKTVVPMKKIQPTISLLPLGNKSTNSATVSLEIPHGTSILKSAQQSVLPVSSVVSTITTSATSCADYSPVRTPTSMLRPQVSITPTTATSVTVTKEPEPPSIIVTPVTTSSTKSSHLTPTTRSSPVMLSTKSSPVMFSAKVSPTAHTAKPTIAPVSSSSMTSSSVIHNATNSVSVSFQPSKVQSAVTEGSSKLSNRSYKSLFDVSAVSAIATADNVQKFGVGVSSAKDFLSEIINKSLADYSNSDKLSSSGYKYRDSPKFTSVLGKCSPSVSNQKSSVDVVHEKMQGFAMPKSVVQKAPVSSSKSDLRGGSVLVTSSLHKDPDHQHSTQDRSVAGSLPQDLRTQSRSVPNTSGSSSSSQRPTSPFKVDMYMPDYLPLSSKFATSVPFHSLYDIQGAIERGLQGQASAPITVLSSPPVSTKVKPHSIPPPSSQSNYYSTTEQPLNFSTSRQSSTLERNSGHNLNRNITSSQMSMGSSQDRSRGSSPLSASSTSVRMVSLPQHQSGKSSSNSSISATRSVPHHDQVCLEGIAASMQDYHLKKTQRSGERSPPSSKLTSSRSDLSTLSPPTSHVHTNHSLSKAYSTYSEPIHSIIQGSTDHRFHRPRCNRPPTLQGNSSSP